MKKTGLTTLAFGNIPVLDSSWFVEVGDNSSVEVVPNVDDDESGKINEAETSLLNAFLRAAGTTSATTGIPKSLPTDVPRVSWFYEDGDDNQDEDELVPPDMSEINQAMPSKKQMYHCNESKRFQNPQGSYSVQKMHYLSTDDPMASSSSLTSTDVSSFSTSSPTPCFKVGRSSMDDEDEDDVNAYSSWFRSSSKLCVGTNPEEEQQHSDPFFEKLPRAKERVNTYSKQPRKLSAQEGYVAINDYGVINSKISKGDQTTGSGVKYGRQEDECSSGSYLSEKKNDNVRNTPRGIARPDPLESHRSGEHEFILPTMIVASNLFVSPLCSPETAFDRPTLATSPSSLSQNSLTPLSRKSSFSSVNFDDASSAGESVKSVMHFSRRGSDNINRLLRRSDSDEWSDSSASFLFPAGLDPTIISPSRTTTTKNSADDPSLSRIFILLLSPETKQFELIQISNLRLSVVTIGQILNQIPSASLVPALGDRPYIGLCRPKDGIEMTAQHVPAGKVPGGWRIIRGEILIAIPNGFSGKECMKMGEQILLNPKLVKLLQRRNPLAPWEKRRSSCNAKSKIRVDNDGGRTLRSRKLSLQAVDENAEINDYNLPSLPCLNSPSSVNERLEVVERHLQSSSPKWKKRNEESDKSLKQVKSFEELESDSISLFSKAEEQVRILKSIASSSYKISLLESVLGDENDDDDKTIASEIWNERVRLATERNDALSNLVGMDVVLCDDISESGKRVMRIQPKNHSIDDATFKSMCAFLAVLLCRHLFKGVGAVTGTSPMGATGLVYCAAIFKSLFHFQRVHAAYHDQHNRLREQKQTGSEGRTSDRISPQDDQYGYSSWRKAANL